MTEQPDLHTFVSKHEESLKVITGTGVVGIDGLRLVQDGGEILQHICHALARKAGWWDDYINMPQEYRKYFLGAKRDLMHTELAEATEGARKSQMDNHLPHRLMEEVELADAIIRILDYAGALELDVIGALIEKLAYNLHRADHKPENRAAPGGKAV